MIIAKSALSREFMLRKMELGADALEIQLLNRTVEAIRGFTEDCLPNAVEKGIIYGVGAWNKGEIKNTKAFKEAFELGKNA